MKTNSITTLPMCKHDYHHSCLVDWLKKKPTCPSCRALVRQNMLEYIHGPFEMPKEEDARSRDEPFMVPGILDADWNDNPNESGVNFIENAGLNDNENTLELNQQNLNDELILHNQQHTDERL